jgi:hypothetical protein
MFPNQFVTPSDDERIIKVQNALASKRYIPQLTTKVKQTSWFERSAHIAKELRTGLSGSPHLDAATLASFVWTAGIDNE